MSDAQIWLPDIREFPKIDIPKKHAQGGIATPAPGSENPRVRAGSLKYAQMSIFRTLKRENQ